MVMLSMVFTVAVIAAGVFAIWLHTKSDKKWLENL